MHCLPLVLLALFGGEQVIDDFRYVDAASARQVWVAGEGTAPVEVADDADRPVLKIDAPFAAQEKWRGRWSIASANWISPRRADLPWRCAPQSPSRSDT